MRRLIVLAAGLLVSGCGFEPLYGGANAGMDGKLASIYVEPVPDKLGYELRNRLIDLFDGPGTPQSALYRLKLQLAESSQGIALQNDATITRYNDRLTVTFSLQDVRGKIVLSGAETALSAYNVLPSAPNANYGTLAAQQDADRRAALDLADRIRLDLSAYFARR